MNCLKGKIVLGIVLVISGKMYSQNEGNDTIVFHNTLEEYVVEAKKVVKLNGVDRYTPTTEQRENNKSGVKLLFDLQIPSLMVDPINNSIDMFGGGKVDIRINGRPASVQDVMILNPRLIQRVDYYNEPTMLYKDADCVVDFIVKNVETGGEFMLNALSGLNHGWGDYMLSLKHHWGKSELGVYYYCNPMWNMDVWRDNSETINFENGARLHRYETGEPIKNHIVNGKGKLSYKYSIPKRMLLSVDIDLQHRSESNKILGTIFENEQQILQQDNNPLDRILPSVDMYFQYMLPQKNTIYINAVYAFSRSHSSREYIEEGLNSICNSVYGYDKNLTIEAMWEKKWRTSSIVVGAKNEVLWSKGDYYSTNYSVEHISDNRTKLFAQWQHSLGAVSYLIGVEGDFYQNKNKSINKAFNALSINPRMSFRYKVNHNSSIKLILEAKNISPSLDNLYTGFQQIDEYQWKQGNYNLHPYTLYNTRIEYDMMYGVFSGKISVNYDYSSNPIMSYKYWESERLIKSYANQRGWHELKFQLDYRLNIIPKWLTLSGCVGWHRYISEGNEYTHTYDQPYVSAQLTLAHNKWFAMAKFNTNFNRLWGEEITGNWNLQIIGFGYTWKNTTFMAGMTNPFVNNFKVTSRDLNHWASYEREYHTNCTENLVWVGITINTSWGKRYKSTSKKLENEFDREGVKISGK